MYNRLPTKEVNIGGLLLGNFHPVRMQTMTTTDTMDTAATVAQSIRCIEAGAELVRITAPSKKEAENLLHIKNEIRAAGFDTPLVADIHFTPNAAEIAARIVEKVRVNPGNYVDKKKFELIEYTDADYAEEVERIQQKFTPLIKICKEYGTAMRIGTNHGSLSDRIMSRYGDTPMGMVESAMEFLRIARYENYHNIVLSMKASNPKVMVEAYRMLVATMGSEFGEYYPLHLGVTEAGDGEDGRIKSAVGIGTLMEEGLGDTIRVSLTEDPEFEIPVCRDIIKRYSFDESQKSKVKTQNVEGVSIKHDLQKTSPSFGGIREAVVIADYSKRETIAAADLQSVGYNYSEALDKWNIADTAADFIFSADKKLDFALPGTLQVISYYDAWKTASDKEKFHPIFEAEEFVNRYNNKEALGNLNFVMMGAEQMNTDAYNHLITLLHTDKQIADKTVLCVWTQQTPVLQNMRNLILQLKKDNIICPLILISDSSWQTVDEHLIHYSVEAGALLLDGFGNGVCFGMNKKSYDLLTDIYTKQNTINAEGRNYLVNQTVEQFLNNTAFGILQATRVRISKTEYISCPSCGRTLFDLQETTAKIRNVTNHLKGVKIAIMGCIVNGPGEMADADFGYVGSGPGKITLYKGKEVVKKNVPSEIAVDELINLLRDNDAWVEKN